jgi:hypothetical protein
MEEKEKVEIKKKKFTSRLRENPWIVSTLVLMIFTLIVVGNNFIGGITGKVVSENQVGENLVDYMASIGYSGFEFSKINVVDGIYEVILSYDGEEIPFYVTKSGKIIGGNSLISIIPEKELSSEDSNEIPKSNKPLVELFVMSYCPYGTQAEKGIIPTIKILGEKVDFRIRYVYYLMHGEKEAEENLREYCIQEIAPEKYLNYMECFLEGNGVETNGYIMEGNDVDYCLTQAQIEKSELDKCIASADEEFSITENLQDESSWLSGYYPLFDVDKELNELYKIGGSPTLVINGKVISSARDSASYLEFICEAFNDAPEECNTELSSLSPSPYFGWESTGIATNAQC